MSEGTIAKFAIGFAVVYVLTVAVLGTIHELRLRDILARHDAANARLEALADELRHGGTDDVTMSADELREWESLGLVPPTERNRVIAMECITADTTHWFKDDLGEWQCLASEVRPFERAFWREHGLTELETLRAVLQRIESAEATPTR